MPQTLRHWRHPVVIAVVLLAGALRLPHEVDEGHGLLFATRSAAPVVRSDEQPLTCAGTAGRESSPDCARRSPRSPFELFDPNQFPLYAVADRTPPQE